MPSTKILTSLERFHTAQQRATHGPNAYEKAYAEIDAGHKVTHWIWFVFPQLKELGVSETAKYYGIHDFSEACDYLNDPTLFKRYSQMVDLIQKKLNEGIPIVTLMNGEIDARKLSSSLTLFHAAAAFLASEDKERSAEFEALEQTCSNILKITTKQGYPACRTTLIDDSVVNHTIPPKILPRIPSPSPSPKHTDAENPVKANDQQGVAPPISDVDNDYNRLKESMLTALESYIMQRDQEPGYWFQGLFKGFSKKDKLSAAIGFRLALKGTVEKNSPLENTIKRNGLNIATLCQRDIDKDLKVLNQGRLGEKLKQLAQPKDHLNTVPELVRYLLAQDSPHSKATRPQP